jgi:hypothetical protein
MAKRKRKKSTALAWIVKEAKRLRREYPNRFEKWTDYVAQASAIYSKKHGGKSPVGKKSHAGRKRKPGKKKTRKVSAVKLIERGEHKNTKAKRVVRINRTRKGTFKKFSTVTGVSDYNHVVLQKIQAANASLGQETIRLEQMKKHYETMPTGTGKRLMRRSLKDQRKLISKLRADVRGFRSLIK